MNSPFPSGQIRIGANYWASHAGTMMWRDWRADIIEKDFALLRANKLEVLRVFPLWPDFQPLNRMLTCKNQFVEMRNKEQPLPDDQLIQDGVSKVMLERFGLMADTAAKHQLGLVVGLVTGWMSGRLFVPPALEGLNPITSPESMMWQVRLVRAMVRQFKNHSAILAWDLGNECNCLGDATRGESWLWTATISNAIRAEDTSRPIISGMHSLQADSMQPWSIRDQGELTDCLTTHPYPPFTSYCNQEPVNTMRPLLHSVAETRLYADLSGRPAMVEEFGNLGPSFSSDAIAADMARVRLYDIWAHDCRAAIWWCAHDQTLLEEAPYDWVSVERELGLFRVNGTPKPVVKEFKSFAETLERLPFKTLPSRRVDAVCLLTANQDQWGVAYSAFILARQAGFDIRFHYADRELPDSDLYLLPCVKTANSLSRRIEKALWEKVKKGATLYVSWDEQGCLGDFGANTGLTLQTRSKRAGAYEFLWTNRNVSTALRLAAPERLRYSVERGDVLACESDGTPAFVRSTCGKGAVFSLMAPLESALATEAEAFAPDKMQPFYEVYRTIANRVLSTRYVHKTSPWLGITEHRTPQGEIIVVLINYLPEKLTDTLTITGSYRFSKALVGPGTQPNGRVELEANGVAIWMLQSDPAKN
jgi:beta-galactosidase